MSKAVERLEERIKTLEHEKCEKCSHMFAYRDVEQLRDELERSEAKAKKLEEELVELKHGETMDGGASCIMCKAADKEKIERLERESRNYRSILEWLITVESLYEIATDDRDFSFLGVAMKDIVTELISGSKIWLKGLKQ